MTAHIEYGGFRFGRIGDNAYVEHQDGERYIFVRHQELNLARFFNERADGSTSDGYHTFDELYDFRMLYNAHAANGWQVAGIPVVKSWRHSDGELCFGGGWFVVVATLPTGQVSNHYEVNYWDLFRVPEVELPPEWDGHTSDDVVARLRAELYRAEADHA